MSNRAVKVGAYSNHDIHVLDDAIAVIRNRPSMYVQSVPVSGAELARNLVGDALMLTQGRVTALQEKSWWIVACDVDWMSKVAGVAVEDLFSRIIPFPQAGANSMHSEVLLTAFAKDVITWDHRGRRSIKGDVAVHDAMSGIIKSDPQWHRVVAFRMSRETD